MRNPYVLILSLLWLGTANAQYNFRPGNLPDEVSIIKHASILNTGPKVLSFDQLRSNKNRLPFQQMQGKFGNLGFTKDNYWVYFQIKNTLSTPITYYLQTAEPVTDNVDLYLVNPRNESDLQRSGDNLDFSARCLKYRKNTFKIELQPGELKSAYLSIRNDGEKNSLPLMLISPESLLQSTYGDQLKMGIFYGILAVIAVTYFFFYFALKQLSFLYYTLYVAFVGICQFALDGFYHQYIGTGNSWLSLHMVIISAVFSCFFFARYSEIILNIKRDNRRLYRLFKPLYAVLAIVLGGIMFIPGFLPWAYPIINVVTLLGILLIFACIAIIFYKKQNLDVFYTIGIFILFITIIMAILMNFGVFPEDFSTEDITKPGIALEIIALSLSMANRIRLLKSKEQRFQALALQKSEEMNDIKSYFLANMSHELRTPLNAIVGLADLMESESNDPKLRASCEIIKYTSHGLISSVTDILDYSKIKQGELVLEKVHFNPFLVTLKIAKSAEKQCADKGLDFTFSSSLLRHRKLIGDPLRLEQIIHNVISNALKFTTEGNVSFNIKAEYGKEDLFMHIQISDTGIGIPAGKLGSVFDLFAQTDFDNKRKYGGFGIGLTIVKALTDLHGGKININSQVNRGTTCNIVLTYPLKPEAVVVINRYPVDHFDLLNSNVLVVEDNPMNQMIIKMMMKDWKNTTIHVANNGLECLEIMKNNEIDIILMDLQMPVMDGYEATLAIREGATGDKNARVPIIVITADTTSDSKERILEIGADDYMNKPIDRELLYQKITLALSESAY